MSGDDISLPHMLTRLGNLAKQRAAEMKTVGIEYIHVVLPMNDIVNSYHNGYNRNAADLDYMYTINSRQLNAKDVIEMHRAYLSDDTEYLPVPMKLIYMYRIIALNDASDIPSDVVKKVEAWRDTMFFAETLQDTEFPILYTPADMQLLLWPDSPEDDTDLSKMLVTVIPDMAQVRITTPEAIVAEGEMEKDHYMNHDLKMDVLTMAHNCAHHPSIA